MTHQNKIPWKMSFFCFFSHVHCLCRHHLYDPSQILKACLWTNVWKEFSKLKNITPKTILKLAYVLCVCEGIVMNLFGACLSNAFHFHCHIFSSLFEACQCLSGALAKLKFEKCFKTNIQISNKWLNFPLTSCFTFTIRAFPVFFCELFCFRFVKPEAFNMKPLVAKITSYHVGPLRLTTQAKYFVWWFWHWWYRIRLNMFRASFDLLKQTYARVFLVLWTWDKVVVPGTFLFASWGTFLLNHFCDCYLAFWHTRFDLCCHHQILLHLIGFQCHFHLNLRL